ncbi:hypothetical protein HAX54_053322, partial [Datura stramonium]|nr:hypothetical protein [Datura stramonium]
THSSASASSQMQRPWYEQRGQSSQGKSYRELGPKIRIAQVKGHNTSQFAVDVERAIRGFCCLGRDGSKAVAFEVIL